MLNVKVNTLWRISIQRMWAARRRNSQANGFFQSPFEANEMFCLLNRLVLFNNQKQPLKCVQRISCLYLWSNTFIIIWKGLHLLAKLQDERSNKMKFLKALTSAQKLHRRTTIFVERLPILNWFCLETW